MNREDYIPKIHWYYHLANYMVGHYSEEKLVKSLLSTVEAQERFTSKGRNEFESFIERISFPLPGIFSRVKSHLFLKPLI